MRYADDLVSGAVLTYARDPKSPASSAPQKAKRTARPGKRARTTRAISSTAVAPVALSLMPGPASTESRWAPTTRTRRAPGRTSATHVLRRRADTAGNELQLDDRVLRLGKLASESAGDGRDRDRRRLRIAERSVEGPLLRVEDERRGRACRSCVPRFHREEARTSADQRDRTSDPVEVVRLAAVTARHQPCANPARRSRGRVLERLDREGTPGRCDLRSALDGLPVLHERKALSTCVVAGTTQLRAHVADGLAIARRGGSARTSGAVGDPLRGRADPLACARPRPHVEAARRSAAGSAAMARTSLVGRRAACRPSQRRGRARRGRGRVGPRAQNA